MMDIKFTIEGNPVPYLRMTQGQIKLLRIPYAKLTPAGRKKRDVIERYMKWKEHVFLSLCFQQFPDGDARVFLRDRVPQEPKEKLYMDVMIYFSNGKHGDPDNVWKGIADSLFKNDNKVAGSFDFGYDKENPRCEVRIYDRGGKDVKQKD